MPPVSNGLPPAGGVRDMAYKINLQSLYNATGIPDGRTVTSYNALSGSGPSELLHDGASTINAGTWHIDAGAYEQQFPYDNYAYNNSTNTWGFKVHLNDQFGRTWMEIHPGLHFGTGGCIGLNVNDITLSAFYNRISNFLSTNQMNLYVHYY